MPIGLTNAPASFQALMNHVLQDYIDKICVVYLNDILIFSQTIGEHIQHVKMILELLKEAKLSAAPEKSEFHKQKIEFLGYVITNTRVEISKDKVKAVLN